MKLLATILVLLAILIAIPFAAGAYADEPILTPEDVPDGYDDVFLEMPDGAQIPPLPAIPTKAEYDAGWTIPGAEFHIGQLGRRHPSGQPSRVRRTAIHVDHLLDAPSPPGSRRGASEGYAALHYGYTGVNETCFWWIRAVAGTRITHDGAVDMCRLTRGSSNRMYPPADPWWVVEDQEVNDCDLDGVRAESPRKGGRTGHQVAGGWCTLRRELE